MQRGYDHGLAGRRSLALIHRCLPSLPRLSAGFTIRLHSAGSLTTTASAANGAGTVTTHPAWTACCGRASPSRPTPPPPATPDVRHVSRGRLQHHLSSSHAGRHLVNGQPPPNLGGSLLMPLILLSLQNRHPLPTTQLSLPRPIQQLAGMTMAHTSRPKLSGIIGMARRPKKLGQPSAGTPPKSKHRQRNRVGCRITGTFANFHRLRDSTKHIHPISHLC